MGNACTLRNDNSSRFGKYVRVTVDRASGSRLLSAHIDTYLLERSRVAGPQPNEANFHLLYQVWRSDKDLRCPISCLLRTMPLSRWSRRSVHKFKWLNGQEGVHSAADWARTEQSLVTIGATVATPSTWIVLALVSFLCRRTTSAQCAMCAPPSCGLESSPLSPKVE
jgi:myosin heavy subunit